MELHSQFVRLNVNTYFKIVCETEGTNDMSESDSYDLGHEVERKVIVFNNPLRLFNKFARGATAIRSSRFLSIFQRVNQKFKIIIVYHEKIFNVATKPKFSKISPRARKTVA